MTDATQDPYVPQGVDLSKPSVARVYDWYLGGTANWAIDREFGDKILANYPVVKDLALANRLFLHRAVRYLAKRGIRQFVDIGSGVPTAGHVHAVADEVATDCRVVYVDHEPVAVAHSKVLLERDGDPTRHAAIQGDLRDPDGLWTKIVETGVIDFHQPIGLLMIAVLHVAQPGPDGADIGPASVARYRRLLAPGSYLAISHACVDGSPLDRKALLEDMVTAYAKAGNGTLIRTKDEIRELFGDFELVEPGMAWVPTWHPEEARPDSPVLEFVTPSESVVYAGVGRKP